MDHDPQCVNSEKDSVATEMLARLGMLQQELHHFNEYTELLAEVMLRAERRRHLLLRFVLVLSTFINLVMLAVLATTKDVVVSAGAHVGALLTIAVVAIVVLQLNASTKTLKELAAFPRSDKQLSA